MDGAADGDPPAGPVPRLARLAARMLEAPFAFVAVDGMVRWSGAADGGPVSPAADVLFSSLAGTDALLVQADAVDGPVRAWAGVRVRSAAGAVVGVLGAGSASPRDWTPAELEILRETAAAVGELSEAAGLAGERLRRSEFLADVSGLVSSLPDAAGLPARLARFCVPGVAALAIMQQYDGTLTSVGIAHRDPIQQARLEAALGGGPIEVAPGSATAHVVTTGEPVCDRLTPDDPLATGLVRVDGQAGPWRVMVPIRTAGVVSGLITWVAEPDVAYGEADLLLATEFARRAALAWERARLFAERGRVAGELQQSLLPARLPVVDGLQVAGRYVAADAALEVGGDFYDLFPAPGGQWLAVIGDVMGRGVEAAGVTGLARHTLRAIGPQLAPAEAVRQLNRLVFDASEQGRFLTMAMARLDLAQDRVVIARGGHCPPMLLRHDGTVERVQPAGRLVGAFPDLWADEAEVTMGAGDTLVLYTDGVIEARRNSEFFGEDGLQELLAGLAGSSAEEIADRILAAVHEFATGNAEDDIALLILHRPVRDPDAGTAPERQVPSVARPARTQVPDRALPIFSTRAVGRLTGIRAEDLAAWSDRYGLVMPIRTKAGTPVYSAGQLDALRLVAARMRGGSDETAAHADLAGHLVDPAEPVPPVSAPYRPRGTVLVVDWDGYLLTVMERNLRAAGYQVTTARTPAEARAAAAAAPVVCAVIEMLLPGRSAADLCKHLVADGVPVLTYSSLRAVDQAFAAGADGFLSKPLNAARLISTVRDILTPAPAAASSTR
ncbi:SpoIIE family protein phosphatase [Catenuloplanes japonicus]|uniref:SpoIIE family protein phosphatase n=1 Tax=Catenuloplanes japonicus TaxID=33876 RepID=UPI0018DE96F8|nr:SpoIIE family protein phosphatase [Catenuloplanes japonicus]